MKPKLEFQVGYYDDLHSEPSINFQINRWINYLGQDSLNEMQEIIPRLVDIASYRHEFFALAEKALEKGKKLSAAYYFRSAEFFMGPNDPEKHETRQKFLKLIREHYGIRKGDYFCVPYEQEGIAGELPVYSFTHGKSKDTIIIHGGFDSYIEEFFPIIFYLFDQGFNIVCFEGPGQGGAFHDSHMLLTHEWQKPVTTILNYFDLDNVTLVGISMGGCLALRAAAFEKRVKRVVAYDVFYDWMDTTLSKLYPLGVMLKLLMRFHQVGIFNKALSAIMKKSHLFNWAMNQAMLILGASSSYEVFQKSKLYTTRDIAALVDQDVLLMAGSEDHIIPLKHFYKQINDLKNARSKTTRLFTRMESAQNHCQIGNLGLAVDFIVQWIKATA